MTTEFQQRARRGDPNGHMTVQDMLYELRDAFDQFTGKILRGAATVLSGNTTVTVSLGVTASTYSVVVQPLADPAGRYWVSGKTSTQFVINVQTAPGGGGLAFDWLAKVV